MAEEEFQESEVIFSDNISNIHGSHDEDAAVIDGGCFNYRGGFSNNSLPVNIPCGVFHYGGRGGAYDFEEEDEDDMEEGEMVPPHVILGRRIAGKMAFSVCTGNGRTLKGRDLSQVRNSILRMTGFLEA
ncbi:hypothetical protein GOBAR_AA35123 [Gossypium barbadense]|uniref:Senescence regulator n=1 Tax=Gossypium barbadense TaxID=3634 RepID=A0A2P5W3A7_GOSBA|nr:hypothetical protein GOBAR_AA35123 [Gossypium barbadense]